MEAITLAKTNRAQKVGICRLLDNFGSSIILPDHIGAGSRNRTHDSSVGPTTILGSK